MEIESLIKNLPQNESPGPDAFTGELVSILLKLFQNIKGNTSKLILRGQYYPDTKARQVHYKKRKLQANSPDEHRCKNPQQNISKLSSQIY